VLRHAAAGRFEAQLAFAADSVRLALRDDARGFDPRDEAMGSACWASAQRVQRMRAQFRSKVRRAPVQRSG
jgi:signal transduction histidine kinase